MSTASIQINNLPVGTSNPLPVSLVATSASSGLTGIKIISAAGTNATIVKNSSGNVYTVQLANTANAYRYVKLYNKASAPTVGTDVPFSVIAIPAGGRATVSPPIGVYYSTGIAYAITTGSADTDTGAVAAGDVIGAILYL